MFLFLYFIVPVFAMFYLAFYYWYVHMGLLNFYNDSYLIDVNLYELILTLVCISLIHKSYFKSIIYSIPIKAIVLVHMYYVLHVLHITYVLRIYFVFDCY